MCSVQNVSEIIFSATLYHCKLDSSTIELKCLLPVPLLNYFHISVLLEKLLCAIGLRVCYGLCVDCFIGVNPRVKSVDRFPFRSVVSASEYELIGILQVNVGRL